MVLLFSEGKPSPDVSDGTISDPWWSETEISLNIFALRMCAKQRLRDGNDSHSAPCWAAEHTGMGEGEDRTGTESQIRYHALANDGREVHGEDPGEAERYAVVDDLPEEPNRCNLVLRFPRPVHRGLHRTQGYVELNIPRLG